jgi:GntR family transcriptional regulator
MGDRHLLYSYSIMAKTASAVAPAASPPFSANRLSGLLRGDLPTPLYHQIFSILRDRIVGGELAHGDQMPTEFELAEAFEVSRITAKRALDELAAEGLVERRRGRGTHVTHRHQPKPVAAPLTGLLENLEILGEHTEVRMLQFRRAAPSEPVRELFDLDPGEELAHAVRVRTRDGVPFGHYVSWTRTAHRAFSAENLAKSSRIKLFRRAGIKLAQVEQTLSAALADSILAPRLEVEPGSALLTLERLSYDPEGRLVDLLQIHYRPDQFRYQMRLDLGARDGEAGG